MGIRLTSDGEYFYDSETGKVLGFVNENGELVYWADGKEKEKWKTLKKQKNNQKN